MRELTKDNQILDLTPLLANVDESEAIKLERFKVKGEEITANAKAAKKRG